MSGPVVTALIDTYNYGCFIEEAVGSVFAQDFPGEQMEVIVVDDGSTDDTPERVKRFGDRLRYIRKPNGGQASALNRGFEEALGEFVALLDADDVWLPDKMRTVIEAFRASPRSRMVYHSFLDWDIGRDSVSLKPLYCVSGAVRTDLYSLLNLDLYPTSALSFRKEALMRILPIPETLKIMADAFLSMSMILTGEVVGVPQPLAKYRLHGGNRFFQSGADPAKSRQRAAYWQMLVDYEKAWLRRQGYDPDQPPASVFLKRYELLSEALRFEVEGASRQEFARHLRAQRKLYAPLWSQRYRFFKSLSELGALLFGYRRYSSLKNSYQQAAVALRLRELLFPVFGRPVRPLRREVPKEA